MLRTFPKMIDVAGVFFTALIVYSVLGAQLFNNQHVPPGPYGYQSNNDNYNNVGHAALATYIFTTTEVLGHCRRVCVPVRADSAVGVAPPLTRWCRRPCLRTRRTIRA